MRYFYTGLVVVFTAAVLLFNIQNMHAVTVSFLAYSVTLPVSLIVILAYILGMATGGALLTLLRSWVRGTRRRPAAPDLPEGPA